MNASAVNLNVTIDDWSSILNYSNPADWTTPDPSTSSWSSNLATSPWLEGTYHATTVVNSSVSLSFQGPAIYVFGAAGPTYGSYSVTVDGHEQVYSAYAANNASLPYLLYANATLPYANHTLILKNLGAAQQSDGGASAFLLDFILSTVQLAPPGATVTNTTIEDNSSLVNYSGAWTLEYSSFDTNGTSTYTVANGATAPCKFNGSAVYIFGDTVNDHGPYTVMLDTEPLQVFQAVKGCSGATGHVCQKFVPSLMYFASNLGPWEHSLTVTNFAINGSAFDLDRFVYTTPSQFSVVSPPSSSSSGSGQKSAATSSFGTFPGTFLLWIVGIIWLLRL